MASHDLSKLEYHKIIEQLSSYCHTYLGKEECKKLTPSSIKVEVQKRLDETMQAQKLVSQRGNAPIITIADNQLYMKQLESKVTLSSKALLEIANILTLARELKNYFYIEEETPEVSYPILDSYFSMLYTHVNLENKIKTTILDEFTIADTASPKLSSLRRNRRKLENDIKENLNKILHNSSYSKMIMESIITIKNDRYVIPIKEEYRSFIKGFIHDVSSSGSTVYIEPISVFETNNKINTIKVEEAKEIERILEELSTLLFPYTQELQNNLFMIGYLDFLFAKVELAKSLDGISPILNDKKEIHLIKAKHPFIPKEQVVPINLSIGKDYTSLIITGPNTGGKTVALKTAGLLTLMACSGLFIPADEHSSLYVFDNVFADIGDEQSIQESLSTFSAHMLNIIHILDKATSDSLILLDELGSGTDPLQGANLAISILEHFHQMGCLTLATTHYQEIKNYALVTEGFENASSEFDIEHLKPTYKLLIGIPGKSNAFAISQKLGLPISILQRAESLLKEEDISIETLLKNIYDDKKVIEKEKESIEKNANQITLLRKKLEQETQKLQQMQTDNIEKAKHQAQQILLDAKEEADYVIKQLDTLHEKLESIDSLAIEKLSDEELIHFMRSQFLSSKKTLKQANTLRNQLNGSLSAVTQNNLSTTIPSVQTTFHKSDLSIGMQVKLRHFEQPGTICSLSGKPNHLQVQIGSAKVNIQIEDILEILKKEKNVSTNSLHSSSPSSKASNLKAKTVLPEINVIGQNIEEATFVIDKYLDDCALAKLSCVRIVHGKGTGKLREGIHTFLKKHPHVKNFRLGTFGEGEMGVTIVELK